MHEGRKTAINSKQDGKYLLSFVETPRKFIIAELSIRKLGSSSVLIILIIISLTSILYSPCKRTRNLRWKILLKSRRKWCLFWEGKSYSEIQCIIIQQNNVTTYEIYNNYVELSIVFHTIINYFRI